MVLTGCPTIQLLLLPLLLLLLELLTVCPLSLSSNPPRASPSDPSTVTVMSRPAAASLASTGRRATTAASSSSAEGVVAMHWFRKGLRLHDNPALVACLNSSSSAGSVRRIYPVYVLDGDSYQLFRCTPLRAQFLVECLHDLDESLRSLGSRLYVLEGDPAVVLPRRWEEWNVTRLSYEQDETGEPYATVRDAAVDNAAKEMGIDVVTRCSETLFPMGEYVRRSKGAGIPTSMSAFQKLFETMMTEPNNGHGGGQMAATLLPAPTVKDFPPRGLDEVEDDQDSQRYLPPKRVTDLPWPRNVQKSLVEPIWGRKDCNHLTPLVRGGETRALCALQDSLKDANWVAQFEKPQTSCTQPSKPSTTGLSPYLSWGCLSPRQVWVALDAALGMATTSRRSQPPVSLHGQLLWRDFNNLMAHDANASVRSDGGVGGGAVDAWNRITGNKYCRQTIDWDDDPRLLQAWKDGQTGYPFIDATMRQLSSTGWIHHLGRHAVACFLTRGDLWQSWEEGAKHFEATLLDADYALNGFNWLWLSCSGFFYQYFRCYSPIAFQKKNDPNGTYIRHYCPELKDLPAKYIYEPWTAPSSILQKAGVTLGKTYPRPIVDHSVISKENMNRMKQAYDAHKASGLNGTSKATGGGLSSGGARKPKATTKVSMKSATAIDGDDSRGRPKKKQRK